MQIITDAMMKAQDVRIESGMDVDAVVAERNALKRRVLDLERSLREMIDVMAPTIRSEMNLTQAQSSARIRAKELLRKSKA